VNKNPQDTDLVYLPERYKQQVEVKKRRRVVKKIIVICTVVAVCSLVYLVLSGTPADPLKPSILISGSENPDPEISPSSQYNQNTAPITPHITEAIIDNVTGKGQPVQSIGDKQSLENANASLSLDYPAQAYALVSVKVTDLFADRVLYEFKVRPVSSSGESDTFSVFVDPGTGDLYTPGQETARITADGAKKIVSEAFPLLHADSVRVRYRNSTGSVRAWVFTMYTDNTAILSGAVDPEIGRIISFTRNISWEGRQADPLMDINAAQKIADRYILDKNTGSAPLNMSKAQYIPLQVPQKTVAGQYVFIYNRIVQEIPCDSDGFTISVDSVTGDVIGYERRWNTPDSAFSLATESLVTRTGATFAVLKKAQETYPTAADGLTIVSAEIRWKDDTSLDSIPRPGSIPVAWKILFTDENIRAAPLSSPAVGWVDIQTGNILDFYYRH
jgi:hypothetical protein